LIWVTLEDGTDVKGGEGLGEPGPEVGGIIPTKPQTGSKQWFTSSLRQNFIFFKIRESIAKKFT
jgi:hypothetical protein